jgi:FKBP-type peptidyl-prolyl cis-trans isomerase 2
MQVEKNKVVVFYYTLRLDSGKILESTTAHEPLHILVGYHQIIPGLEKALMGMKMGDKKSGTIEAKEAYGLINEKLVKVYPRSKIPRDINLKRGRILKVRMKNGKQIKVVVKSCNETEVVLDSNHPLAGKNLRFRTKIVHIREATQKEMQAGKLH